LLTEIFGSCPKVKVIDLLISNPWSEYTKTDIANYSGIARSTLYNFLGQLEEYGIIKPTKMVGRSQLYKVNMDSEITQLISAFQLSLADIEIGKQVKSSQKESVTHISEDYKKELSEIKKEVKKGKFAK
jgi:Fe2+ or Zn2+ uptake regulation protein